MTRLGTLALCAALVLPPALSRADDDQPFWTQEGWPDASAAEAQPPQEAPPAPPVEAQPAPAPQASPQGQWVYTQQYGWIWQPYSDAYTQVPANGHGEPLAYVYYPSYGWTWLAAPWIWGIGPWPVFGVWGPARYAWYGHGWWRYPNRWHYAPSYAWGGHRGWAPGHGGRVGITRPAPGGYRGYAHRSAVAPSRAFSAGGRSWGGGAPAWNGGGRGGGGAPAWKGGGRGGGGGAHVVAPRGNGGGGGRGGGHAGGRHR